MKEDMNNNLTPKRNKKDAEGRPKALPLATELRNYYRDNLEGKSSPYRNENHFINDGMSRFKEFMLTISGGSCSLLEGRMMPDTASKLIVQLAAKLVFAEIVNMRILQKSVVEIPKDKDLKENFIEEE